MRPSGICSWAIDRLVCKVRRALDDLPGKCRCKDAWEKGKGQSLKYMGRKIDQKQGSIPVQVQEAGSRWGFAQGKSARRGRVEGTAA